MNEITAGRGAGRPGNKMGNNKMVMNNNNVIIIIMVTILVGRRCGSILKQFLAHEVADTQHSRGHKVTTVCFEVRWCGSHEALRAPAELRVKAIDGGVQV